MTANTRPVKPCPEHECTLRDPHEGEHMDPDGRTWAITLPTSTMALQVSRLLAAPGLPARSTATLRRADVAFGILDALPRSHAPLPGYWRVVAPGDKNERQYSTDLCEDVSEALRETGGRPRASVRSAWRVRGGRLWMARCARVRRCPSSGVRDRAGMMR